MRSVKKLRLVRLFYSSFLPAGLLISLLCGLILAVGGMNVFVFVFWFKVISTASLLFYIHDAKRAEFFYYQNLGLSKSLLFILAAAAEFAIFVLVAFISIALSR